MTDVAQEKKRERRWIRPLPERLVNKIAAGEVIERPASVLKELVENAIDAGATRIEVIVEKSGTTRIEVHDNGIGIPADQLQIAFSRHATSKISNFDDLEHVNTYGFRGEALPSIASVSRLRMVSKSAEEDHATEIHIEGGVVRDVRPAQRADGTSVIIEDLFFNTPARKKFLKSEQTEARQISRAATAQALGAIGVALSVRLNGRKLFSFSAEDSLAARAAKTLGVSSDLLLPIDAQEGSFSLVGALGKPELARSMRGGLYLYVNNRALRSSSLLSAFSLGYGELLARGLFPVGVAQLEVDSSTVDVNVHPAKSEVRLSEEREAHTFIRHAVRDALRQEGIAPEMTFAADIGNADEVANRSRSVILPGPRVSEREVNDSMTATAALFGTETGSETRAGSKAFESDSEITSAAETEQVELLDQGALYLGQFSNLYLLAQRGSELYLVDQHAAHERILYEENMAAIRTGSITAQRLLFPINIELSSERFLVWENSQEELKQIGFEMSHLGGQTVMLSATPSTLTHKSPEKTFSFALDDIQRLQAGGYTPLKAVAQSIACRSAVMDGDTLHPQQARAIIEGLFKCETGYSCPHGRPTFIKITRKELDRRFGRE